MANFEEQFLLFLVPYESTSLAFHPSSHPKAGQPIERPVFKDADGWMQAVRNDVTTLSKSKVGRLLLDALKAEGKVITIRPRPAGECNSMAWQGDTLLDRQLPDGRRIKVGTGHDVQFNPATYAKDSVCATQHVQIGGFHIKSDEILLHELIHAFRNVSGKHKRVPLGGGLSFYENNEEFNAVLMQGIYASERRTPIRSSHFRHFEIDAELNSSMKFFKSGADTFKWVERFCLDHPKFTRGISQLRLPFNPIRAYYLCSPQVKQMLRSAIAQRRDKIVPIMKAVADVLREHV